MRLKMEDGNEIKIIKHGKGLMFDTGLTASAGRGNRKEFEANFSLILENSEKILSNKRFFFCDDIGAFTSFIPVGGGEISLGILLLLWKKGEFTVACKKCGGPVLLFQSSGSLLSGACWGRGVCSDCRLPQYKSGGGSRLYWPESFATLRDQHPNVKPAVEPATVHEIIEYLKSVPK